MRDATHARPIPIAGLNRLIKNIALIFEGRTMAPHAGYLFKKGGSRGNWRKRYFVLSGNEV